MAAQIKINSDVQEGLTEQQNEEEIKSKCHYSSAFKAAEPDKDSAVLKSTQ